MARSVHTSNESDDRIEKMQKTVSEKRPTSHCETASLHGTLGRPHLVGALHLLKPQCSVTETIALSFAHQRATLTTIPELHVFVEAPCLQHSKHCGTTIFPTAKPRRHFRKMLCKMRPKTRLKTVENCHVEALPHCRRELRERVSASCMNSRGRPHLVDDCKPVNIDHFGSTAMMREPPLFSALAATKLPTICR